MASGFDDSVSRIQPRTKKKFFRPRINNNTRPADPEKRKQVTQTVLQKEKEEIDAIRKSKTVKNTDETSNTGNKIISVSKPDQEDKLALGNNPGLGNERSQENPGLEDKPGTDDKPGARDTSGVKHSPGNSKQSVLNKKRVPVQEKEDTQKQKAVVSKSSVSPMKLYSIHSNSVPESVEKMKPPGNDTPDNVNLQSDPPLGSFNKNGDRFKAFRQKIDIEEEKVETILPYGEPAFLKPAYKSETSSQEVYLHTGNDTVSQPIDINGDEPEDDTTIKKKEMNTTQDRFKSLKKRLDSFNHQDPGNVPKKNRALENADTIKNVIKNYQSKIKHLTEELAALEDTYKFTRDELEGIKQDLYKKSLSLEHATKLGREKTTLSEEILKEMEITVFERDRAFTTIAELKTVNEYNEALLKKASQSLEEKEKELEGAQGREKELLKTIKMKDGEINNLQLALAKRTADRDELFDRLEDLTIQLEEIDKSNSALDEIKGLIDRDGKGLLE